MKTSALVGSVSIMLASCAAMDVTGELNRKFHSSHIDAFFETYGSPDNIQIKKGGTWTYEFTLGRKVTYGTHTQTQVINSEAGSMTKTPYAAVVECVIVVYTDEDGLITDMKIRTDNMVNFQTSRCMEIFSLRE